MRRSGLGFLGDVPSGSHLCQFYHQQDDLLEAVIPFLQAGLERDEYGFWIVPSLIDHRTAVQRVSDSIKGGRGYLQRRQLELFTEEDWYHPGGSLDHQKKLIDKINRKIVMAKKRFAGIRGAGGMHKLGKEAWSRFLDYEASVHKKMKQLDLVALCTYHLPQCPLPQISRVIDHHHKTFLKKGWNWEVVA